MPGKNKMSFDLPKYRKNNSVALINGKCGVIDKVSKMKGDYYYEVNGIFYIEGEISHLTKNV